MNAQLCRGRPPEWWDPVHGGARLAMAICRVCPDRSGCLEGDPRPVGVIRAGVAFSNAGAVVPICPTCGYPQAGATGFRPDRCPRCDVPTLSRWRPDIDRWHAEGVSDEQAGRWVGATAQQIRDARRPRKKGPPGADSAAPDAEHAKSGGDVDEVMVERALAGERVPLTDHELLAALHAGRARGMSMPVLADRLGVNDVAAYRLLRTGVPPRKARHAAMTAELRSDPHRTNAEIAALVGVSAETVRRARRAETSGRVVA